MESGKAEPTLFVIVGGTGDLARRKLLPALRSLAEQEALCQPHALLAVARDTELDDEGYRRWAREALASAGASPEELHSWCDRALHYQPIGKTKGTDYRALAARIEEIETELGLPGNRVFYLALPPRAFPGTIEGLTGAGLHRAPGWVRLVIEKPFGRDLATARELNDIVHRHFDESQIYRIDHYLGKETVQNLLVFRFANAIFESLWTRDRIDHVQITVAESIGIEGRSGYYDRAGALRDMVQNHVSQLLSLIGMEVPSSFAADPIRYEKIKLLKAIRPPRLEDVVFGQYERSEPGEDAPPGYREEPGVAADSTTETYVAMRLWLDNWRWQGGPFYIRSGKRLERRLTQIAVTFRPSPICLFESDDACPSNANVLYLTLQPDEGFALCFDVKVPGEPYRLQTLPLDFYYHEAFGPIPDAYQTLLYDVLTGDQTLFVHAEEAEASWQLFGPFLEAEAEVHGYPVGSWGPTAADRLLEDAGHDWLGPLDPQAR